MTFLTLLLACGGGTPTIEAKLVETPPAPEPVALATPTEAPAPAPEADRTPAAAPEAGGTPPEAPAPAPEAGGAAHTDAGAKVYAQYCQACHQADGTGMGGLLAVDLVNDRSRFAKSDEDLLTSIREGVSTGSTPMPAWGATLSQEQMVDVLAYMRATFGG